MEDRSELSRIVFGETVVVLTRDLSVMNPNLVSGLQGLVVWKAGELHVEGRFPSGHRRGELEGLRHRPGEEGNADPGRPAAGDPQTPHDGRGIATPSRSFNPKSAAPGALSGPRPPSAGRGEPFPVGSHPARRNSDRYFSPYSCRPVKRIPAFIPERRAPSISDQPSPTWTANSGRLRSCSSAARKILGGGFRPGVLVAESVRLDEVIEPHPPKDWPEKPARFPHRVRDHPDPVSPVRSSRRADRAPEPTRKGISPTARSRAST